jgi:hypothetical protein
MQEGKKIGRMDGVNLIQWFVKNRYRYTGTFSRFVTNDPTENQSGMDIDIIFSNKRVIIKDAKIEWIKSQNQNGTFHAARIESYEIV